MRLPVLLALLFASGVAVAQPERICQTPDCLQVENVHSQDGLVKSIGINDTRLHFYVFVPKSTREFTLEVFDQNDDNSNAKASQFDLFAPDGTLQQTLDAPKNREWASYHIETGGKWGVWRLSVTGPQDIKVVAGQKSEKACNAFMVRTRGEVDLYLKPEPVARVRGLCLSEPRFGGLNSHAFTLQNLDATQARFNLLRDSQNGASLLKLDSADTVENRFLLKKDDRLKAGLALETVEFSDIKTNGLTQLHLENVRGVYGLGIESEARLFFGATPLMKLSRVEIETRDEIGLPIAARVEISSPQTTNENNVVFTDSSGRATFWALDDSTFSARATRGFDYEPRTSSFGGTAKKVVLTLPTLWPKANGWISGDSHCHTSYYDGTHTPRQMVEAAKSAGLDWIVVSEHAHSENIERIERAYAEAALANSDPNFFVISGMEYTGPQFHANILGGLVLVKEGATLSELLANVQANDTPEHPLVCKLNHPTLGKTAAQIARETPNLSLIELWNSSEPDAMQLWFELMNHGQKVWVEASSDSHHRVNLEPGSHRTLVLLGDEKPSANAILHALREGRSILSRGATLDFSVDGARSGATIEARQPNLKISVETYSARPIDSVEIIARGDVIHRFEVKGKQQFAAQIELPAQNGWMLARVIERGEKLPLALSNPVWITSKVNQ